MALQFGKVTGRFVAVVADSPEDSDSDPDVVPLQGVVTFTLKAPALLVPDAEPFPMTALPAPVSATLDNEGYLTLNGTRSVTLLASNGQHNPTSTTYEVKFALKHGTISVPYSTFNISVPAGETVNLTTVAPVPSSSGSPIVQGIGIKEVTADDGAFVFKMTNGTENRVGIPAIEPPATTTARCVQSVALDGSSLVFSFTDKTSERVDLSSLKGGGAGETQSPDSGITPTPVPVTEARRAVILGDSHSDPAWPQADGVWWWQVAADLSGVTVLDVYAVGGMTTRDALDGWDDRSGGVTTPQIVQAEGSDADLAIMEFGGNDVSNGIDATEYRANLTEITKRLMASGKRVLIMAPPPLFAGAVEDIVTRYAEYRRIDEEVAAACSAYYMDAWSAIGTGPGGSLPSSYDSGDHIHMNSYGQMALGKAVAARVQQVAGVADPYDGVRDIRWFGWDTVQGDDNLVLAEPGPQDTLFKGAEVAGVTSPAEGTEDVNIYSEFNSTPGAVWEVSYAYRIDSSTGRANITPSIADWPGGFTTEYPQRDRLVGLEGVRRYEVTIAERATDNAVFFLKVPAVTGKLTARVGMLGMRLLKDA